MAERGRIREIKDGVALLALESGGSCFGCMKSEGCPGRGCSGEGPLVTAGNPLGLPLSIGQVVEIETPAFPALLPDLAALLIPVLGFAAVYAAASGLFPASGNGFRVMAALAAFFAAGLAVFLFRKRFPPKTLPRVKRTW